MSAWAPRPVDSSFDECYIAALPSHVESRPSMPVAASLSNFVFEPHLFFLSSCQHSTSPFCRSQAFARWQGDEQALWALSRTSSSPGGFIASWIMSLLSKLASDFDRGIRTIWCVPLPSPTRMARAALPVLSFVSPFPASRSAASDFDGRTAVYSCLCSRRSFLIVMAFEVYGVGRASGRE